MDGTKPINELIRNVLIELEQTANDTAFDFEVNKTSSSMTANSCDGGDGPAGRGITHELPAVDPKGQGRLFGNYEDQMLPD